MWCISTVEWWDHHRFDMLGARQNFAADPGCWKDSNSFEMIFECSHFLWNVEDFKARCHSGFKFKSLLTPLRQQQCVWGVRCSSCTNFCWRKIEEVLIFSGNQWFLFPFIQKRKWRRKKRRIHFFFNFFFTTEWQAGHSFPIHLYFNIKIWLRWIKAFEDSNLAMKPIQHFR